MSHSSLLSLSIVTVLAVALAQPQQNKGTNSTNSDAISVCLTKFENDRAHFERCKNATCLLFLNQAPFIQLDPRMKTEADQKLFPCRSPTKYYENLEGISFKIHQQLNLDNLFCVWAGSECTFNKMVEFVGKRAQNESTKEYRFGVTGLVAQLPERLSEYTIPTVQLFESEVVILGPSTEFHGSIHAAFSQIFQAFETSTWVVLCFFSGLLVILSLAVSCVFTRPLSPFNILMNLCGDHTLFFDVSDHLQRDMDVRRSRALHRAAVIMLGIGFSGFVVISILFYELSVVSSIVEQQNPKVGDLAVVSNSALERYSVLRNSAPERVLRRAADPAGSRFRTEADFPWFRCWDDSECYKRMMDKNDLVKYMVVFEPEGSWNVLKRQACDSITKYTTSNPLFLFSGGWYLGTSVPLIEHVRMNREILRLKMTAKLRQLIENDSGLDDLNNGEQSPRIAPGVLAIPLIFIVGPCLVIVILLIISGICMRERVIVKEDRAMTQQDIWSTLGRSAQPGFEYET